MVNVYRKERINDQTTICAGGGGTGNTTYLGGNLATNPDIFEYALQREKINPQPIR